MSVKRVRIDFRTREQLTAALARAAEVLSNGGVISFATETYYALGANPQDENAVRRVFRIKGRDSRRPVPLLVSSLADAERALGCPLPVQLQRLAEHFWPGPLTLVAPSRRVYPAGIVGADRRIGIRWPCWPFAEELLKTVGSALVGTSANPSGCSEAESADQVMRYLGEDIDLIFDTGRTQGGAASTVVGLAPENDGKKKLELIREGRIPLEALAAISA